MNGLFLLLSPTLLLLIASGCTKVTAASEKAEVPPPLPRIVETCRAHYQEVTGESQVSNRADMYCYCTADVSLKLTSGYTRLLNKSEEEATQSMCFAWTEDMRPVQSVN